MGHIDRYIGTTVLLSFLFVMLVIVGLDTLFSFISELEDVGGAYTAFEALTYILMTVPRRIYTFIPMSALVGCLVGLGILANNSELTVMRAAGISTLRILRSVMQPVLVMIVFGALIGEFVAPIAEQQASANRSAARSGKQTVGAFGVWHREGSRYMHLNAVYRNGTLQGVTQYDFDASHRLTEALYAQSAQYRDGAWTLKQVQRTAFSDDKTRVSRVDEMPWETGLEPKLLGLLSQEPDRMSVRGLYQFSDYMNRQNINAQAYELALWNRLLQPLAMIGLVLIGMSFAFGSLRSVTMGQRILVGTIIGLIFKFSQDLLGPVSMLLGFPALAAALLPILICLLVGGWLLKRAG